MRTLDTVVRLRITKDDQQEALKRASSLGMNLSQYIRFVLKTYEPSNK